MIVVLETEVGESDSSRSVFLSQDCFGFSGSFMSTYKYEDFSVLVL